GRLSRQRNRRGHAKTRKTETRRGFARGKHAARRLYLTRARIGRAENLILIAGYESEQSTLGKRRLHAHCRDYARKRRGARAATRNHKRTSGPRPRMRRWHDGIARGETRSGSAGRRYRAQPGGGWE